MTGHRGRWTALGLAALAVVSCGSGDPLEEPRTRPETLFGPVEQELTPPASDATGFFGQVVALEGDRLLVGSPTCVTPGPCTSTDPGQVHLYTRSAGSWSLTQSLSLGADADFGKRLAMKGNLAVTSAATTTRVFHGSGSWTALPPLPAASAFATDGSRVVLVTPGGTTVYDCNGSGCSEQGNASATNSPNVVIAGGELLAASGANVARFQLTGGAWSQVELLAIPASLALALHGTRVLGSSGGASGAVKATSLGTPCGGGPCPAPSTLVPPPATFVNHFFGASLAVVDANYGVVGSPGVSRVHIYHKTQLAVTFAGPNGSDFGRSVSVSGDTLAVGAPKHRFVRLYGAWLETGTTCETDKDCETGFCKCATASCATRLCCATNCSDTEVCSPAGSCAPKLANGEACDTSTAFQCNSGYCIDGVCCQSPCDGQCETCANATGACSLVTGSPAAGRPACAGTGQCAGSCDGNSKSCVFPGSTTSCGAQTCSDDQELRPLCDGQGACSPVATSCGAFACGAEGCNTSCESDAECNPNAKCDDGICVPVLKCEGDDLVTPGDTTSCAPYGCVPGVGCRTQCSDSQECATGHVCNASGACVAAPKADKEDSAGCACALGTRAPSTPLGLLAALGGLALLRRRGARSRQQPSQS